MAMPIPSLGLGTWGMGGRFERDESGKIESVKALKFGLELGFRLIDTAEIYGGGLTEEIVGQAIKDYKRGDIFLITKVWKENLTFGKLIQSAKQSLKRLGTDYIDLYLIHGPNPDVPLAETLSALETLVAEGVIKNIGVSNFSIPLLELAQRNLKLCKIFACQFEYNLFNHIPENEDILVYCQKHDIKVIAYRPLAKGEMGGSVGGALKMLTEKYKKTPAQIALNWLSTQGITAIPKATNLEHLKENFGSLGWELTSDDVELLKKQVKRG